MNPQSFLAGKLGAGRVNAKRALGNLSMAITYPRNDSVISGSVAIKGSANIDNFTKYTLQYSPATDPTNWKSITTSNSPVDGGLLGIWSISDLSGRYNIKMTVYDASSGGNF